MTANARKIIAASFVIADASNLPGAEAIKTYLSSKGFLLVQSFSFAQTSKVLQWIAEHPTLKIFQIYTLSYKSKKKGYSVQREVMLRTIHWIVITPESNLSKVVISAVNDSPSIFLSNLVVYGPVPPNDRTISERSRSGVFEIPARFRVPVYIWIQFLVSFSPPRTGKKKDLLPTIIDFNPGFCNSLLASVRLSWPFWGLQQNDDIYRHVLEKLPSALKCHASPDYFKWFNSNIKYWEDLAPKPVAKKVQAGKKKKSSHLPEESESVFVIGKRKTSPPPGPAWKKSKVSSDEEEKSSGSERPDEEVLGEEQDD